MSDGSELIALSYCSTATFEAPRGSYGVHPEVNRILSRSRRNNRRREIGGVLHFGNGCFFQYLEGEAGEVDPLFRTIAEDSRHRDVRELLRTPIDRRRFEDWSMKFVVLERVIDGVLERAGMESFDPYAFTPEVIEDLVASCIDAPEGAPAAGDRSAARARSSATEGTAGKGTARKGLLARLLRR